MKKKQIKLLRETDGTLSLVRANGKKAKDVRVAILNPIQKGDKWYELQDRWGKSLHIVGDDLLVLDPASRRLLEEDVRERYVIPKIRRICSLHQESHVSYWDVITDRGPRDFVMKDKLDNMLDNGKGGYTLKDVMGNYFSIEKTERLDSKSQKLLARII